jgi:hypothetical protein
MGADARKLLDAIDAVGELGFGGDQDGEPLLDREVAPASGADERLLVARERGFALGVDWTAKVGQECVVHEVIL